MCVLYCKSINSFTGSKILSPYHNLSPCLRVLQPELELVTSNIFHCSVHTLNLKSAAEKGLPCANSDTAVTFYFLPEFSKMNMRD